MVVYSKTAITFEGFLINFIPLTGKADVPDVLEEVNAGRSWGDAGADLPLLAADVDDEVVQRVRHRVHGVH